MTEKKRDGNKINLGKIAGIFRKKKSADSSNADSSKEDKKGKDYVELERIKNVFKKMSREEEQDSVPGWASIKSKKTASPEEGETKGEIKEKTALHETKIHEKSGGKAVTNEKKSEDKKDHETKAGEKIREIKGTSEQKKETDTKTPKEAEDKSRQKNKKDEEAKTQGKTPENLLKPKKETEDGKTTVKNTEKEKKPSGIKSGFGKEVKKETDKDEEIDIRKTVTEIRNIFKKDGKREPGDWRSQDNRAPGVLRFFIALLVVIGLTVSVWVGSEMRMQAGDLEFTNQIADSYLRSLLRNSAASSVDSNYPLLDQNRREIRINEEVEKEIRNLNNSNRYYALIEQISARYRDFYQDDLERNYMPDIDSYYWLRYANNVIETGRVGDEVRDGVEWDNLQLAPTGLTLANQDTFYPKTIAYFHKFAGFFAPLPFVGDTDLIRTLMFYPVFISALTIILVFMLTKRMAGGIAAFFAAIMVGVHPVLFRRTMFGHGDTDAFVVFFSVLVLWLFIEAFNARKLLLRVLLAGLAGIASGLYSLSWGGWWWIFDFVMLASTGTLALFIVYYAFFSQSSANKKNVIVKLV